MLRIPVYLYRHQHSKAVTATAPANGPLAAAIGGVVVLYVGLIALLLSSGWQ